jgi:hypothetical protein
LIHNPNTESAEDDETNDEVVEYSGCGNEWKQKEAPTWRDGTFDLGVSEVGDENEASAATNAHAFDPDADCRPLSFLFSIPIWCLIYILLICK